TFEPAREARTASRELALRAAAGGLAPPGPDATAEPAERLPRALGGLHGVLSHDSVPVAAGTGLPCRRRPVAVVATAARFGGGAARRSSSTTTSPARRSARIS